MAYSLQKEYGANIMLNQGFLKMASDRLGGNYYVMPISRWEVMLISGAIDQTTEERIGLNKIWKIGSFILWICHSGRAKVWLWSIRGMT